MPFLLADLLPDATALWTQTIVQLGALGILAYWIIKDRPKERQEQVNEREKIAQQHKQEHDDARKEREALVKAHQEERESMIEAFREEARESRAECERNFRAMFEAFQSRERQGGDDRRRTY